MLAPGRDAQVRATGDLVDKPLVVLNAGDNERTRRTLQDELTALSTDSTHICG